MNTRRAVILILIATLLGLHTVYTRMTVLDLSLRTGQLYHHGDRLAEEKLELEVNLSIIRQPVNAARLASKYCPTLQPEHPELAAYLLAQDVPKIEVPSLRKLAEAQAATEAMQTPIELTTPATDPAVGTEPLQQRHGFDRPGAGELPAVVEPDPQPREWPEEPQAAAPVMAATIVSASTDRNEAAHAQ